MKPDLRVALLGQGFMGKAHSNAYCQAGHFYDLPYRLRRTLLCGRDAASLERMADRWGWDETSTDWRAAIDRKDIDVVDIALPNHLHAPAAIAAAEAGKIVFCEKPLALSVEEGRAMVAAARGRPTLVWFNYRRVPAIAYARQLIDEGRLGQIFHYNAAYRQQWGADTSRAATWRMDPAQAGSGVADDLLTHLLDTALYLNGQITQGVADARTIAPNRQIDDAVMALVKFENGSAGTFEATRFAIGCKNQNSFDIHGTGGLLRFNLERLNHLEFVDATVPSTEQGPRDLLVTDLKHPIFGNFWRPGHIIGYEHTFIATLAEFLDCLAREADFHPSFEDALVTQRTLDALLRSARTRQWTDVG
jgi:predicted dehydrogenase